MLVGLSQESQDSEQYGDENEMPVDPQLISLHQAKTVTTHTCTPTRTIRSNPREIHTVSKVPLRPADDDTPLMNPRKRSRSLCDPLKEVEGCPRPVVPRSNTVISYNVDDEELAEAQQDNQVPTDNEEAVTTPIVRSSAGPMDSTWSCLTTPRTIRQGADSQIMRGAVVFVDVHTSEGADASGIFVELLTQMGARCVKQWTWNPRASLGRSLEESGDDTLPDDRMLGGKVGITHVVYKDGGKRTLEKVRESKGLVLCVGVGWVLE